MFCTDIYLTHMDYYLFLNGKCWELRKVSENSSKKIYAGQRKQKLADNSYFTCIYMHCRWRSRSSRDEGCDAINLFNVTFVCLFHVRSWIFNVMSWSFCVQLRWEVIVRFVDIGEIDDHHCLNFLFIIAGRTNLCEESIMVGISTKL